jgi:hypothetical protein
MGIAIWILTKRMILGLLTEVVSFLVLFLLSGVSMEAAGLAHLMGAVVLLGVALFVRGRRQVGMGIIGVAGTAIIFTKVNVGIFVMASMVVAVVIYWPSQLFLTARKIAVAFGLLVLPVVLMQPALAEPAAWHYCVLELIYLVGFAGILLTKKTPVQTLSIREIAIGVGAAVGATILIAVGVLINGTSLPQFISGAIFGQRGLTKQIVIPLPITGPDVAIAIISSIVALVVAAYVMRRGQLPPLLNSIGSGYLRFAIGIWILLTISEGVFPGWTPRGLVVGPTVTLSTPGQSFLLAAPFVWVALLGGRSSDAGSYGFARLAICLMGVLGCLEGFPVAGSQMLWASLTLVPVGVICITDGLSMLTRTGKEPRWVVGGLRVPVGSLVALVLFLFLVLGNVGQVLSTWRGTYDANKPVRLLGAHMVRLPQAQVQQLQEVTQFLQRNCSTYYSLPGFNSFYFLSGEMPPTDFNSTQAWWNAFSFKRQNQIAARLRVTQRLCLIEGPYLGYESYLGFHIPQTQLVQYIESDFVSVKTVGAYYHLLVRRPSPISP